MSKFNEIWRLLAASPAPPITALFEADPARFDKFSARFGEVLLDFSKTSLTGHSLALLLELAATSGVETKRDAMFAGEKVNVTENRAVLHTALRAPRAASVCVDGKDVIPAVHAMQERLFAFAEAVRSGALTGTTGLPFTDIVNIGIGGSDLGPVMVTGALAPYHDGPRVHFVSNVDAAHLTDTLKPLDPARTLFIVASKTFTTVETMTNAHSARRWLVAALGEDAVGAHFAAVSTALDKIAAFGISPEKTFGFWDWVGGRYSVWSAIGLPVIIAIGAENFRAFLAGAHAMDEHFRTAPLARNLPVLLALCGVWHRNACNYPARAVLPYEQRLSRLPAYLQQLDMESNGKRVTRDGMPVAQPTGPLVFGEPGTNGQHAFYQLLHQGTDIIPCEFLIAARGHEPELRHHHEVLIANCLGQAQALMRGRTLEEAGGNPHRVFPGNRPSLLLAYPQLTPESLGQVIALYEHRIFTEAAIWNINAFDQWGVELGKELAVQLSPVVAGKADAGAQDSSTAALINFLKRAN
jgi:glucose-6-phosphate isomerase